VALGIQTESGSGGGFTPTVKINSKQGRVWRVDRTQGAEGWTTDEVDITGNFQFVPDLDNLRVGWMFFKAGQAPDLRMVQLGDPLPDRPSSFDADGKPNFKQGVIMLVKLGKDCGGDLREIAATAKSILGPIDKLHDEFLSGRKDNAGKLPIVKMKGMKKVDTKTPKGTNTNFEPEFEITGWVDKPSFEVAGGEEAKAEAPKTEAKAEPAREMADANQF
jgi:hypothetical protein